MKSEAPAAVASANVRCAFSAIQFVISINQRSSAVTHPAIEKAHPEEAVTNLRHRDQQPDDESAKDYGSQFSCSSRQNHIKADEGFVQNGGGQGSQSWVQALPALGLQTLQRVHLRLQRGHRI
jgi:hypothetical protein